MTWEKLKKIEIFSKTRFLTVDNLDLDDVLCDFYWPKSPLASDISFKNFKRVGEERQGQKQKELKKRLKNGDCSFFIV